MNSTPYRPAVPADASALAQLVNIAGEGMPLYLWARMTAAGADPWETGRQRALRDHGGFSYRNAIVREASGKVVATLIGYPLCAPAEPADYSALPPMFAPLQQLEDQVPGTWYVNVLATLPEHRNRGIGTELLAIAEQRARTSACQGLSIIVSDGNPGAIRLYERNGFVPCANRPMVKDDWINPGAHWVLLTREF